MGEVAAIAVAYEALSSLSVDGRPRALVWLNARIEEDVERHRRELDALARLSRVGRAVRRRAWFAASLGYEQSFGVVR